MSGRLALLLAVLAGCQDREVVGAVPVKSVRVLAASGILITVTAEEDPVLAGLRLRIPSGSLPHDLTVTIERGREDIAGAETMPAGPAVIVGPVGTQLSLPMRLGLPVTPETPRDRFFIETRDPDGRRSRLASTMGTEPPSVQADVDRFAAFQAARLRPGAVVPDAGVPPPPPVPPPQDAR